jgi:hypothetical protein
MTRQAHSRNGANSDTEGPRLPVTKDAITAGHAVIINPVAYVGSNQLGLIAYIDPGAGSMIVQVVIAGALALPFFFRTQASRVLGHVRRVMRRRQD